MNNKSEYKQLHLEQTFLASESTLFDAWITPPVSELWLYQDAKNPLNLFADIRQGGAFHTEEKKDSKAISHFGKYVLIERPHKLVFNLEVPSHFKGVSEIVVEIKEEAGGCHLSFTQKNVDTSKTEKPWRSMFEQLEKLVTQPYLITNNSTKDELNKAINVVVMQAAGFIMPLNEQQVNKIPFNKSWTASQLIRHLVKSISGMAQAITADAKPADRQPGERILSLKQSFLDITHTMQSPEFIVPEEKKYEKEEVLKELYDCLYALNRACENIDVNGLITGLPLGAVTKLELLHFTLYHTQRHLIQMKKITDLLKEN